MAQGNPDEQHPTVDQIMKLVAKLSPDEQDELMDAIKLAWLRNAAKQAEKSVREHGTISADEALAELEERNRGFRRDR